MNIRYFLLCSALLLVSSLSAQNVFRSGDGWANEAGWGTNAYFLPSLGGSQIFTTSNNTMGPDGRARQYFRLGRDFSGYTEFGPFSPCADEAYIFDTEITLANWCGNGAFFIDVPDSSYRYVFKTPENTATANRVITFEIQGAVSTPVDRATTRSAVCEDTDVEIYAILDNPLPGGQATFLRYSDDGFASSTVVAMACTGVNCTAQIPASVNTAGTTVDYYILTSGSNVSPDHTTADWFTISFDTYGGGNYSYTVASTALTNLTPDVCIAAAGSYDLTPLEAMAGVPAPLPGGASVTWYRGDSATGNDVTASKASISVSDAELFTLVYNNGSGCTTEATVVFSVTGADCGDFPWDGKE